MFPRHLRPMLMLILPLIGWLGLSTAGFVWLANYKAIPGEPVKGQSHWPRESSITRVPGKYNFVLALNPHCPCSQATVTELTRLVNDRADVTLHVLAFHPSAFADGWEECTLLDELKSLPVTRLHVDVNADSAEQFGIFTSGGLALYGLKGELLFQGGITPARGHVGETDAHRAIRSRLLGETTELFTAPVFGCPLRDIGS